MKERIQNLNWSSAITAGLLATIIMTVVMGLMGMNIVNDLGNMMLGRTASSTAKILVGGMMHLMIGLIYAVIFPLLFSPLLGWQRFVKGAVFGIIITVIAFVMMPVMATMTGGANAENPCSMQMDDHSKAENPCSDKMAENPCNPCADKMAENPCNPCADKMAENPCNPNSDAKMQNNNMKAQNACSAANPCSGSGSEASAMLGSLFNHLIFGLALALFYKDRQTA